MILGSIIDISRGSSGGWTLKVASWRLACTCDSIQHTSTAACAAMPCSGCGASTHRPRTARFSPAKERGDHPRKRSLAHSFGAIDLVFSRQLRGRCTWGPDPRLNSEVSTISPPLGFAPSRERSWTVHFNRI